MKFSMKKGIILAVVALCFLVPAGIFAQEQAQPVSSAPAQAGTQASDGIKALFKDAPAADMEIIAKAEDLVVQGKWSSAWNLLSQADPESTNPYMIAEKIRIALDGYAQTAMHVAFTFVDLPEGVDLDTIRSEGSGESVEPVDFSPATLASALEEKGEAIPPVLSYMLGNYYYEVWKDYQGQWLLDEATVLKDGATEFERAYAYDLYTRMSLDRYSEMLIATESWEGARTVTLKALELEPENLTLTLRLANAYYGLGLFDAVPAEADKVIADKNNREQLANGYIVGIKAGLALADREMLDRYLDGFEVDFPQDYFPGLVRHLAAVNLGDREAADEAADAVTAAFPGDPDVVRSIVSTWLSTGDTTSAFNYINRNLLKEQPDEGYAALYFYRALLNMEIDQSAGRLTQALTDLSKSEEYFKKSYPAGHQIFGMIDSMKKEWGDLLVKAQEAKAQPASDATSAATATE
ncbi:MAG: hypothetical protein LLF89_07315 [Spirochaetaceae bacterium]|nr:hypothetical protein [Spirochaetaceae bacterium]